ncbi:hypothetical protein DHEL01_v209664 [Diaporthe helianthi]|uniref:Rhodopsin domain-containing protein n=1 Tax=Diaporthe helianthi TaxID=158607 RepID=A0A2P5HNX6_DIAHE|nr:hypothetical protein DHEL01_v209664 [Diaporthe helianthi]
MSNIWTTPDLTWAGVPPPGETRHEVDPPSTSASVIGFGAIATMIAATVVCLRLNMRMFSSRGLKLDDCVSKSTDRPHPWLTVPLTTMAIQVTAYGVGKHIWDVLWVNYTPGILQLIFFAQITGASMISFNKLSVLSLYISITPNKKFRAAVYLLMVVVVVFSLAYILSSILDCHPVQSQWDLYTNGHCATALVPDSSPIFILSLVNIVVDVAVVVLPIPVILPLQIPRSDKIWCLLLFAAGGGLVLIAAIGRTIELMPLLRPDQGNKLVDITWLVVPELNWAIAEGSVGIVAASLPAIRPVFKLLRSKSISGGNSSPSGGHHNIDSGVALENVSVGSVGSKAQEPQQQQQQHRSPCGNTSDGALHCGHGRDEEEGLCPCRRIQGSSDSENRVRGAPN